MGESRPSDSPCCDTTFLAALLLLVPLSENNGLLFFVCQNKQQIKAQSIVSKLHKLHQFTKKSFRKLHVQGSKQPKESTGGILPALN